MLKLEGKEAVDSLGHLAALMLESESIPADWLKQLTVSLYKKGPSQNYNNYRGIALLSVPGKAFCRVVQIRLSERAEQLLRETQCGFRKRHGCIDLVFSTCILAEKAREFNSPLYLGFMDLQKA